MKKCHRAKIQLLCLCNKQCLYFFGPSPALTFLTEHAVAEEDLCEDSVALQDSSQHAAGVCGDALTAQVQSAAARHCPRVMQLSQNRLLSLYSSLFTQPQIRPPEVLHERLTDLQSEENTSCVQQSLPCICTALLNMIQIRCRLLNPLSAVSMSTLSF